MALTAAAAPSRWLDKGRMGRRLAYAIVYADLLTGRKSLTPSSEMRTSPVPIS